MVCGLGQYGIIDCCGGAVADVKLCFRFVSSSDDGRASQIAQIRGPFENAEVWPESMDPTA